MYVRCRHFGSLDVLGATGDPVQSLFKLIQALALLEISYLVNIKKDTLDSADQLSLGFAGIILSVWVAVSVGTLLPQPSA